MIVFGLYYEKPSAVVDTELQADNIGAEPCNAT